jgi:hypothetical protein
MSHDHKKLGLVSDIFFSFGIAKIAKKMIKKKISLRRRWNVS